MNQFTEIKAGVAAMVGALSMIWGWLGWLVVGWVVCVAIDYISGSAAAAKAGEWSSAKARDGIWHKAWMILVVVVSAIADAVLSDYVKSLSYPQEVLSVQWGHELTGEWLVQFNEKMALASASTGGGLNG